MVLQTPALPELARIDSCRGCGERIGWVTLPGGKRRPVDVEPKPLGEYALLRDGMRAISLREDPRITEEFDRRYPGPRFWDHMKSCALPSMAGQDPVKEERRQTLLDADKARDDEYPGTLFS